MSAIFHVSPLWLKYHSMRQNLVPYNLTKMVKLLYWIRVPELTANVTRGAQEETDV
jgi:hypothetical protein